MPRRRRRSTRPPPGDVRMRTLATAPVPLRVLPQARPAAAFPQRGARSRLTPLVILRGACRDKENVKVAPASKKHVDPGTRTRTRTIAGRTVTLHSAVCMRCLSECARIGYCRHTLPQACTPNFAGAIFPIGRRPTAHKASCASGYLERRVAQQACCSCPCLSFLRPCRQSPSVPEPEPVSGSFSFSKARSFYAYCSPSCSLHSVGLGDLFGGREGGQVEKENERGGRGGGERERESVCGR